MTINYILDDDGNPVPCEDVIKWGLWMTNERPDVIQDFVDSTTISTAFLGVDLRSALGGPPLFYETMIFGGVMDGYMMRTPNQEQAEAAHQDAIQLVRAAMEANLLDLGHDPKDI